MITLFQMIAADGGFLFSALGCEAHLFIFSSADTVLQGL